MRQLNLTVIVQPKWLLIVFIVDLCVPQLRSSSFLCSCFRSLVGVEHVGLQSQLGHQIKRLRLKLRVSMLVLHDLLPQHIVHRQIDLEEPLLVLLVDAFRHRLADLILYLERKVLLDEVLEGNLLVCQSVVRDVDLPHVQVESLSVLTIFDVGHLFVVQLVNPLECHFNLGRLLLSFLPCRPKVSLSFLNTWLEVR